MGEKLEEVLRQKNEQISFLQKEIAQHNYSQIEKQTLKEELYTLKTERQALLKESYEHSEVCVKMKRIIQSYKKTDKSNERFDEEDWKQLIAEKIYAGMILLSAWQQSILCLRMRYTFAVCI